MEKTAKKTSLSRKLLYIVIPLFVFSVILFGWVVWDKLIPHPDQKVHYHAGFIVIKDNKIIDFSNARYMSIEPCTVNSESKEPEDLQHQQLEKAHLHDTVGDVVHVENSKALWKDLFTNLHFPIHYQNTTAYINGNKVQDFQNQKIQPYQSLVLFIGDTNDTKNFLSQAVTKQHILEEEKKSEDCGLHG